MGQARTRYVAAKNMSVNGYSITGMKVVIIEQPVYMDGRKVPSRAPARDKKLGVKVRFDFDDEATKARFKESGLPKQHREFVVRKSDLGTWWVNEASHTPSASAPAGE